MKVPTSSPRASLRPGPTGYQRESGAPTKGLQELGGSLSGAGKKLAADFAKRRDEDERTAILDLSQQGEALAQQLYEGTGEKAGLADLEFDAAMSGVTSYETDLDKGLADLYQRAPGNLQPKLKVALDRVRTVYALKGQTHAGRERVRYKTAIRQAQADRGVRSMAANAHTELGVIMGENAIREAVADLPEGIRESVFAEYAGRGYENTITRLITDSDDVPGSLEDARLYFNRDDVQGYLGKRSARLGRALESAELDVKGEQNAMEILSHEDASDDYGRIDEAKALERLNSAPSKERPATAKALQEMIAQSEAVTRKQVGLAEDGWFREVTGNGWRNTAALKPYEEKLRDLDPGRLAELQRMLDREGRIRKGGKSKDPSRKLAAEKAKEEERREWARLKIALEKPDNKYKTYTDEQLENAAISVGSRYHDRAVTALVNNRSENEFQKNTKSMKSTRAMLVQMGKISGTSRDREDDQAAVSTANDYLYDFAVAERAAKRPWPDAADLYRHLDRGYQSGEVLDEERWSVGFGVDVTGMEAQKEHRGKVFLTDEEVDEFEEDTEELNAELKRRGKPRTKKERLNLYRQNRGL